MTLPAVSVEIELGALPGPGGGMTGDAIARGLGEIDPANAGWEDVSQYARAISVRSGRQHALARMEAATCSVTLSNQDRRFDPTYTDSPYYPNVEPLRRIRVRSQACYAGAVRAAAPVAYWRLGDAVGQDTALDETTNNLDGTRSGSLVFGGVGAIPNDPSTSCGGVGIITIPDSTLLHFARRLTIEAWIKPNGYGTSYIVSKPGSYALLLNKSGVPEWLSAQAVVGATTYSIGTGNLVDLDANGDPVHLPPLAQWSHVAMTFDGQTLRTYLNGVYCGMLVTAKGSLVANSNNLYLFAYDGTGANGLDGSLDEVAVYSRVLTGAELLDHYQLGLGTDRSIFQGYVEQWPQRFPAARDGTVELTAADALKVLNLQTLGGNATYTYDQVALGAGPLAYWRFNDGVGSTLAGDLSGNEVTLTATTKAPAGTTTFGTAGLLANTTDTCMRLMGSAGSGITLNPALTSACHPARALTVECWFAHRNAAPAAALGHIVYKDQNYVLRFSRDGSGSITQIVWQVYTPTVQTLTYVPAPVIAVNTTHYLAAIYTGSQLKLYVDYVLVATQAATGEINQAVRGLLYVGSNNNKDYTLDGDLDELAIYGVALTDEQVRHHYTLGIADAQRIALGLPEVLPGFYDNYSDVAQREGARLNRVLTDLEWSAELRQIDTGRTEIKADDFTVNTTGALDYCQKVAETGAGQLFAGTEGAIVFQDRYHRQLYQNYLSAVLGEDGAGGEQGYGDVEVLYGEEDLYNDVQVTGEALSGITPTGRSRDTASAEKYFYRTLQKSGQLYADPDDAQRFADYYRRFYGNPYVRTPSLHFELGDWLDHRFGIVFGPFGQPFGHQVRIHRRLRESAPPLEVDVYVEGIEIDIQPGKPWSVTLRCSPVLQGAIWILDESALNSTTVLGF